jgi:hypothetical protein
MNQNDSVESVSETIVIVDMVGSTSQAFWLGWERAGRPILRALRSSIEALRKEDFGLACQKFTGDGYMLTFDRDGGYASLPQSLRAMSVLSRNIKEWNALQNNRLTIKLRFAIHFAGVDKFDNDREGLEVAFAFRLEGVNSIENSINCSVEKLPEHDYAILSEQAVDILKKHYAVLPWCTLGVMPIKSFGKREVFLLDKISELDCSALRRSPA